MPTNPYGLNPSSGVFTEKIGGDDLTKFMKSQQNQIATSGAAASKSGTQTFGQGLGALGPVLESLTSLVKGDQGDITQAIQPEANRIKDSFAAVRSMISQSPRGGGKAGVLAEAPYKEQQQIQDVASQKRAGATGELGGLASTLAGLGLSEQQLGEQGTEAASKLNLDRRKQNAEDSAWNRAMQLSQTVSNFASAADDLFAPQGGGGALR